MNTIEEACKEKVDELIANGKLTYQHILLLYDNRLTNNVEQQLNYDNNMRLTAKQKERQQRDAELYNRYKASNLSVLAFAKQEIANGSMLKQAQIYNIIRQESEDRG